MGKIEHSQIFPMHIYVIFYLVLVSCELFILLYQAEHKPELNCYDSDWITPSYEHALHSLSRFYSPSNSFLKIEPKPETLSCGFPTEVRVHYVFTPDVIGEQKKTVIYYLVRIVPGYFNPWPQRVLWHYLPHSNHSTAMQLVLSQ